ncbi:MAG TPA: PH domain-containing protein [Anaerolineales bacterium]|nr:PH domain-containing protein [Anaerolineales bacterium]
MAKKSYLQELLGKNESILLITRQHWFVLFSSIALEILLIIIIVGAVGGLTFMYPMAMIGLVLVLVPLAGMLRDIIIWYNREYVVTNRRVIQITGVFSKNVVDSSLEKVNDVKMSQSFFGRLFDYGDVEILTASEIGVNLFKRIGDPVKFKTAMINAKEQLGFGEEAMGERHLTSDIPTLIAELDELRKKGILSEEEFQRKKTELLQKI